MLNARHKSVLFLTLVVTGCALLAGASLKQGLGLLILGATFAWLLGSRTVYRGWVMLRGLPAAIAPSLRFPFVLALAGAIFGAVLYWSNFNTFLALGVMTVWGLLMSSERLVLAKHSYGRAALLIMGFVAFFLSLVIAAYLLRMPVDKMERVGELAVYAIIAIAFGRFWLSKAVPAIVGLFRPQPDDIDAEKPRYSRVGLLVLSFSLLSGTLVLALWVAILAFNGFTESVVPLPSQKGSSASAAMPPGYSVALLFMLLTWWPYAAWSGILRRIPPSISANRVRHKIVLVAGAALTTILVAVGATFGLQNGHDRALTAQIEIDSKAFAEVAQKMGGIKSRNLETTDDYIAAYAEISPLLDDFERKLASFDRILAEAKRRDSSRGPLNIQLFSSRRNQQTMWNSRMFKLLHDDCAITRRQVAVTTQMAELPEEARVDFWNRQFLPLAEEEERLRNELQRLMSSNPQQ